MNSHTLYLFWLTITVLDTLFLTMVVMGARILLEGESPDQVPSSDGMTGGRL